MSLDHQVIEELLAADALSGLEPAEREDLDARMAEHGTCAECEALRRGYVEAAGLLAASLDPMPVDPAMADAILTNARRAAPSDDLAERREARSRRWVALVALAAVFVLVVSIVMIRESSTPTSVNWAQRVVAFDGESGEFAMAYVPGRSGVVFWGQDLPDPGAGRTLEVWMIPEDGAPVKGACLTPSDGRVAAFLDADVGIAEIMAVTVEPEACPDAPTTEPIYTAELV
jgi:anti-sigma-K factor RskA